MVVFGLTFLVWWPLGWGTYFDRGHQLPHLPRNRVLLSRNQQTEVRYILDLMDRYPECVFITRNIKVSNSGKPAFLWGWFGRQVRMDLFEEKPGETLEAVANENVPESPCVLFYYGLDCNKVRGDCCLAQTENRPVLEEHLLENLQYTDFHGTDAHPSQIRLAVLWVR
jgi:hypothetical protein